MLRKERNYLY
jgi:hypothetical protein